MVMGKETRGLTTVRMAGGELENEGNPVQDGRVTAGGRVKSGVRRSVRL